MTPELKTACELVFQEHRLSPDLFTWNKDAFRGRISIGLREMAKETLVKKNIIYFPNRAKKVITVLNPAAAPAETVAEAEELVRNHAPAPVTSIAEKRPTYISVRVSSPVARPAPLPKLTRVGATARSYAAVTDVSWYLKPVFCYFIWPACAAAVSIFIAYVITSVQF